MLLSRVQAQTQSTPGLLDMRAYYYSKKASKNIENQKKEEANQDNLKALEYEPELTLLQSNLGVTFDLNDKKEEAEKIFRGALKQAQTADEKYAILFNLGYLLGGQKKIAEALEAYQQALDLKPDSVEVKHNIELLIQQQQQDKKKQDNKQGQGESQDQKISKISQKIKKTTKKTKIKKIPRIKITKIKIRKKTNLKIKTENNRKSISRVLFRGSNFPKATSKKY